MIGFEWNQAKASANYRKHGVSFEEAKSVFFDDYAIQYLDDQTVAEEDRFLMLGMSIEMRILLVCHCERRMGKMIRIISARKATKKERRCYPGPEL